MPYGFICGFPTKGGGDLYGGNLYGRSQQAKTGLQAAAAAAAAARWGAGAAGRECIGHSVCKGKYRPWKGVERQYGCFRHHAARRAKVQRGGLREGWESFEQWPRPPDEEGAEEEEDGEEAGDGASCARPPKKKKRKQQRQRTPAAAAAALPPPPEPLRAGATERQQLRYLRELAAHEELEAASLR